MASGPTHQIQIDRLRRPAARLLVLLVVCSAPLLWAQNPAHHPPPKTRVDGVKEVIHGVEVVDPYRWLENRNDPQTEAWIKAQNDYTRSILGSLPGAKNWSSGLHSC